MLAIIDGDIIVYRVATASKDVSGGIVKARFNQFMEDLLVYEIPDYDEHEAFLTGTGNFRYDVAVTKPYKGNRTGEKPEHWQLLREHAVKEWGFVIVDGIEADDAIGILATKHPDSVILTIDKDLDMIPGKHYNFVKKLWYDISPVAAIYNFYRQLLTGDRTDNIPGLTGIGPKRADKILDGCVTEEELYNACLEAYEGNLEYMKEQGDLLWIRQNERQQAWTNSKSVLSTK